MTLKILNLYAGIGGNRKLWSGDIEITAIEINPEIAKIYQDFFPNDKVIIIDAHQYLLEHFKEFDFIWSSPPCPSHSRIRFMATKANNKYSTHLSFAKKYPDMDLYQEIIFLTHYFKGKWVVENVISYYNPLIKPQEMANHYFWANFNIGKLKVVGRMHNGTVLQKQRRKGFDISKYKLRTTRKDAILRNCVEPEVSLHIFNMAFKEPQTTLIPPPKDKNSFI